MVRDALVTSVTWVRFSLRCHTSQVSTVPKASSPRSARARAPGTLSSSQAILVALKYGSITRPVFSRTSCSAPSAFNRSHSGALLRSCQTMALWIGSPVWRSQTIVVSRWLLMPIASTSLGATSLILSASRAVARWVCRISFGSCSTQPGCGKIWRNSCCALETGVPSASNRMARELVVPWSRAST